MQLRVGLDVVDVGEVARSIDAHGDRYVARVCTVAEREQCAAVAARVAERVAAKEAVFKALREEALPWQSVEALHHGGDWELALHGAAARRAAQDGLQHWGLSLTRAGDYVSAVVLAGP